MKKLLGIMSIFKDKLKKSFRYKFETFMVLNDKELLTKLIKERKNLKKVIL